MVGTKHMESTRLLTVGNLRAHIDRTQAARLYAGNIEYGYFVREMEARCQAAGVAAGQNADQLIAFAASLSEQDLRSAQTCLVPWRLGALNHLLNHVEYATTSNKIVTMNELVGVPATGCKAVLPPAGRPAK